MPARTPRRPLVASLTAVAVNIVLKVVLTGPFGVVGLALGTALGAWVNLVLLALLAYRRDWTAPSGTPCARPAPWPPQAWCSQPLRSSPRLPSRGLTAAAPVWRSETLLGLLGLSGRSLRPRAALGLNCCGCVSPEAELRERHRGSQCVRLTAMRPARLAPRSAAAKIRP